MNFKNLLFALAMLFFGVAAHAQTVTVTSPNGGETLYSCQTYTITWSQTGGVSNYWNIAYSLNGGSTWTSVTSNFLSANGQFTWTVPTVISTNVKVRVVDAQNTSITDQSNASFNIARSIAITSPNGGESWQANSVQNITWTAATTSGSYNILYSTDSGISWTTIVSNYAATNSYAWTLPSISGSSTCLIRVQDYNATCKLDQSDAVFTITPPGAVLVSPNGGESLNPGCVYPITWDVNTFTSTVDLAYSTNNGSTWTTITTAATNNGSYNWTVPNTPSGQCKVRASSSANALLYDISNNVFSISPAITVTAPNGGETLWGLTNKLITWTNTISASGQYTIEYTTDGGNNWITEATNITGNSYSWSVPNASSTTCWVRVSDYVNPCKADISNTAFKIMPADPVLYSPNGNENIYAASTYAITWEPYTLYTTAQLDYSLDNGTTWVNITNAAANTGSYNWTVPTVSSTQCVVRLSNTGNLSTYDISQYVFNIKSPVTILTPNQGYDFSLGGCTLTSITFDHAPAYNTFNIDYSTNGGATWIPIVNNYYAANNPATYDWDIPNLQSTQVKVRVIPLASGSCGSSVNMPYGGGFCTVGNLPVSFYDTGGPFGNYGNYENHTYSFCPAEPTAKITVNFSSMVAENNYDRMYIYNGGSTSGTFIGQYSYTPPTTTSTAADGCLTFQFYTDYLTTYAGWAATVTSTAPINTSLGDESNGVFAVSKPLNIITPNTGGTWAVGSVQNITWEGDGSSNVFDVYYSTNGGASYTPIATSYYTDTNTLPWTVPNSPSSNCKIWVQDNTNSCKSDSSDVAFTIAAAASGITITSLNTPYTTLTGCMTTAITWTETAVYGTYNIDYSINGGNNWINVATSYATTAHSYTWSIPNNINTNRCLVRVSATANPSLIYDVNNVFLDLQSSKVNATPANVTICAGTSKELTATGGTTYLWTPSTGLSNSTIANPIASPTATTNYIVQSVVGYCTLKDTVAVTVPSLPTSVINYNGTAAPSIIRMCIGQSRTLNSQTVIVGNTYTWYRAGYLNNDGVVVGNSSSYTVNSPGIFYLVVTSPNGCSTKSTAINISIDVCNPNPVGGAISGGTVITNTPKGGGVVPPRGGAPTAPNHSIRGNGRLAMYPNPAKESITVVYENDMAINIETVDVTIFDITGRMISTTQKAYTSGVPFTLATNDLQEGMYILQIADGTTLEVSRFMITK